MIPADTPIWTIIIILGIGTFLIRFSFIGLVGNRPLPAWLLRHLRYTGVTVIPALVAPLVVWPTATDGAFDVPRFSAAIAALVVGYLTKNTLLSIVGGAAVLALTLAI